MNNPNDVNDGKSKPKPQSSINASVSNSLSLSPLPLHTSQSVPILYRSTDSFSGLGTGTGSGQGQAGMPAPVLPLPQSNEIQTGLLNHHVPSRNDNDDSVSPSEVIGNRMDMGIDMDMDMDMDGRGINNGNGESESQSDCESTGINDDDDDDDTFDILHMNACDIEDQATTSSVSISMNSFSNPNHIHNHNRNLNHHNRRRLGHLHGHGHTHGHGHGHGHHNQHGRMASRHEEENTSSDSEDAVPYNALFYQNRPQTTGTFSSHSSSHILEETDSGSTISSKNSSRHSLHKHKHKLSHPYQTYGDGHGHDSAHVPAHGRHGHGNRGMRRNDASSSTVSSMGTFSKHKKYKRSLNHSHSHTHTYAHPHEHEQEHVNVHESQHDLLPQQLFQQQQLQARNMKIKQRKQKKVHKSYILAIMKALALFWVSSALTFLFYHVYIYNPSPSSNIGTSVSSPLDQMIPGRSSQSSHIMSNHIPFPPPPSQKISVVLMNHSRPRMIKESTLVPTLLHHPSVSEVILLHSNPKTAFHFLHPKVINIDATQENDQMGLSLRFYFCQLVKNEWVLHVDDDMEFTEKTLNEMLGEFSKNTKRIVGRFGRNRKENSYFNGYSSKDTSKESEVILTKFMVMERDTCSAFFQYSHLIWEDIILNNGEGPLWNGEDVFMSLVSNHIHGHGTEGNGSGSGGNYAMDWLDVRSAPEELKDYTNGKFDISGGFDGLRFWDFGWWRSLLNRNRHYSYRGTLWKEALERLKQVDLKEAAASASASVSENVTADVKTGALSVRIE